MEVTRTQQRRAWLGLALALAAACDSEDPFEEAEQRDARAVALATGPLDGAPRLIHLASLFALPPDLDPTDPEALLRDTVTAVHARLAFVFGGLDCEAAVDTDGQTRVGLSLSGCTLLLWSIDSELEAVARVETEACETGTCATAVRWDLDIGELTTGPRLLPPVRFAGPAELRAAVDPAVRMQWQTQPGFTIETPLGLRFETLSTASWTIGADDCVEVEIGARLSLEERPGQRLDALDERIGDVVLSGRNLRRCAAKCPERGRVELSFGAGHLLAWEHDGSDTILVEGPRGRMLEADLPCEANDAGE